MCGDGNGGGDGDNGGGNGFLVGCFGVVGRYPDLYGLGAKSLLIICSFPLLAVRVRQRRFLLCNDSAPLWRILAPKRRLVRPRRSSRHLTATTGDIFYVETPKKSFAYTGTLHYASSAPFPHKQHHN